MTRDNAEYFVKFSLKALKQQSKKGYPKKKKFQTHQHDLHLLLQPQGPTLRQF